MNLYFVRHGQSEGNVANIHQPKDSPLTEKGLRQAEAVGERFKHGSLDIIFSSPFKRAKQTAEAISLASGKAIEFVDVLGEMMPPSVVVGLHENHPEATRVMNTLKEKFHDTSYKHSDEDTFIEVKKRIGKFLEELPAKPYENVVVVTHGLILRMLAGLIIFGSDFSTTEYDKLFYNVETRNTGVSRCKFEDGKWKLITWNDYSHWME